MNIYVHIGDDGGDYEEVFDLHDLADTLLFNNVPGPLDHYNYGDMFTSPHQDHISIYYGEDVETPVRGLTEKELLEVNRLLDVNYGTQPHHHPDR